MLLLLLLLFKHILKTLFTINETLHVSWVHSSQEWQPEHKKQPGNQNIKYNHSPPSTVQLHI